MSRLSLIKIQSVFDKVKALAQNQFDNRNYNLSLRHIETAADLAYSFNWIYSDEDLENLLVKISNSIISDYETFTPIKGRIVLFDDFAIDNRGLTQQYLRAFISWGVELLFVFGGNDLSHSKKIISEINAYSKAELFVVDSNLSKTEKIKCIYDKVADFKPEKAFLHLRPSSVVAVVAWNALKEVTRYQINLTDHAFWLGTKCIDYSLEFRDYGCTVSFEKRNLARNQLLIHPYYPIFECKPFLGFPPEISIDAIKVFTGGAYYKMYGKSDCFFLLLKIVLEINPKVVVLLAGNGEVSPIKRFISENNYEKRIFLLGSRPDITHVFENCDIYLSTFPVTGGLMGQYAASMAKPILSYSSSDIPLNFLEGFIDWNRNPDYRITHTSIETFRAEAIKMISDKSYRESKGHVNKKHIINDVEFSLNLKKIITINKIEKPFVSEVINYEVLADLYLESENKYLKQFDFFIVSRFRVKSILLFPRFVISFLLSFTNFKRLAKILLHK